MAQAYVMGEDGQLYSMGDTEEQTEEFQTVGAAARPGLRLARPAAARPGTTLRLPPAPAWRPAVAPGVDMPGEGMEQLSFEPAKNNGVFTSSITEIEYIARPQRAFQGERPVVLIGRSGTSATGVLPVARPGFFVGTQVVGANLGDVPLDGFGPTAFGVRMRFQQATPGMLIRVPITLIGTLAPGDFISLAMFLIGRSVRLPRGHHAHPPRDP